MFVYYHNEFYFSMSITKDGGRKTYKTKYFRFLLDKEIESIYFYGSCLKYDYIRFTDEELNQLEVFNLIDSIVYN